MIEYAFFEKKFPNAHHQRANARSAHLVWHSRVDGEQLGIFFQKRHTLSLKHFSTLAPECSLWEHSGASAHHQRANARLDILIWHSHVDGEHWGSEDLFQRTLGQRIFFPKDLLSKGPFFKRSFCWKDLFEK